MVTVFGHLSDKLGRRRLFVVALGVYLVGSGLTAATFGHGTGWVLWLYLTRFIAGMGIGGEYAAINSAIDEMIPSHYRGRVDIAINGTNWGGAHSIRHWQPGRTPSARTALRHLGPPDHDQLDVLVVGRAPCPHGMGI